MSNYNNLLLNNQLCFALYSATNAITRSYRSKLGKVGLTYPQYLAMLVLWESDGLSVKILAQKLKLDSPTMTPLIKRLENAGFVSRKRSEVDERVVNIFLTEQGSELEHEVAKLQEKVACETELSESNFIELRDTLHELVDTMCANMEKSDVA